MELTDLEHRDLAKERKLILDNGSVITFKCKDPYGFWTVHYEKGTMPAKLRGSYTTFEYAYAAVKQYLANIDNPVLEERMTEHDKQAPSPVELPKFEYKSAPPPRQ